PFASISPTGVTWTCRTLSTCHTRRAAARSSSRSETIPSRSLTCCWSRAWRHSMAAANRADPAGKPANGHSAFQRAPPLHLHYAKGSGSQTLVRELERADEVTDATASNDNLPAGFPGILSEGGQRRDRHPRGEARAGHGPVGHSHARQVVAQPRCQRLGCA